MFRAAVGSDDEARVLLHMTYGDPAAPQRCRGLLQRSWPLLAVMSSTLLVAATWRWSSSALAGEGSRKARGVGHGLVAMAASPASGGKTAESPSSDDETAESSSEETAEAPSEDGLKAGDCGNDPMLNDFDSLDEMKGAGWKLSWMDDFAFKPLVYRDFVPPGSFWGFRMGGKGDLSLKLHGTGTAEVDFGNLLGTPGSFVDVALNDSTMASAGPSVISQTVKIHYQDGDTVSLKQGSTGIIVLNRVSLRCAAGAADSGDRPGKTGSKGSESGSESGDSDVEEAEDKWRSERGALDKASSLAEKKQQEHFAAVKLEKRREEAILRDREEEQKLEGEEAEQGGGTVPDADVARLNQDDGLVKALASTLTSELAGRESWVIQKMMRDLENITKNGTLSDADKALKALAVEKLLAKQMQAAVRRNPGLNDHGASKRRAERLEQTVVEEERQIRHSLRMQSELKRREQQLKHNRTWHEELLRSAREQAERTAEELLAAEKAETREQRRSDSAARQFGEVVVIDKEGLEKKREQERVQETEEEAKEAVLAELKQRQDGKKAVDTSLYCWTLMLPFGYEPALLAAQEKKGVGVFSCEAHVVFSNSTIILDSQKPSPVEVALLDFSLSVPYGGRWHTALNTPVFNKIWTKVRDTGLYQNYGWVVKADPDTVFFPSRLASVLSTGLPEGLADADHGRRLREWAAPTAEERRLQQDFPASKKCKHCRLKHHKHEACEDHAKWLQKNKNMSCDDALAAISRHPPVDCGCECTRLEACDLSEDRDWRSNGHFIEGDYRDAAGGNPAVYINNCQFGLHGPIEVLSSGAVTAFVAGLEECDFLLAQAWGEDKYLDRCMMFLGITRVNVFGLLSEVACGEEPAPCGAADVAFHPFKKHDEYFNCWSFAHSFGHSRVASERKKQ